MLSDVNAEILTIGDEICRGEIINTNASWLATQLWDLDITTTWMTSCRDEPHDMVAAFNLASQRADLIVCTGGLGPTLDDRTCDVLADLCETSAVTHASSLEQMKKRYRARGRELTPKSLRQVRTLENATTYLNPVGAAPGFMVPFGNSLVVCLPGPPMELKAIFNEYLVKAFTEYKDSKGKESDKLRKCTYRLFGLAESEIATRLDSLNLPHGVSLHYQVKFPEILIKLLSKQRTKEEAEKHFDVAEDQVLEKIGDFVHGTNENTLPKVLAQSLLGSSQTLAIAESCTGGLIGSLLTQIPGASNYFLGSMVTYTNQEKTRQLGVSSKTLLKKGAVSEECVMEMAKGCIEKTDADTAIAVSGIAGPGGGTEEKPVGMVWLAVMMKGKPVKTFKILWPGSRERVRLLAAYSAMSLLLSLLKDSHES